MQGAKAVVSSTDHEDAPVCPSDPYRYHETQHTWEI